MQLSGKLLRMMEHFISVIEEETGFSVLLYDSKGYILRATNKSRIGDLHAGGQKIMQNLVDEYAVTPQEAAQNPLVREGYSCPIIIDGQRIGGFGITGKLALSKPVAHIANEMLNSWVNEFKQKQIVKRSERKYRRLFDNSVQGIFQATVDGRYISANKALATLFGYSSPKSLMTTITNISSQLYTDAQDRNRLIERLRNEGEVSDFITRFRRQDGSIIDARINAQLVATEGGRPAYLEGIVEDITEKIRIEEAVRQSEEKYFKAFNHSPVWVVLSTIETGKYLEVNQTFLRTMGFRREEVIGHTSLELGTWENPEDRKRIRSQVMEKGYISNFEVIRLTRSKKRLTMLLSAEAIKISGQASLLSVSQDITERKQAEENLRLSQNNLGITLDSIGDAVITTDTKGTITRMNFVAESYTGWSQKEALGRPLSEIFQIDNAKSGEPNSNLTEKVQTADKIPEPAGDTILTSRYGTQYQIAYNVAPIRNGDGEAVGMVLVFRDVTEQKRWQQKIAASEQRFRGLFDKAPVIYVITDTRNNEPYIQYVNHMFTEVLGYSREEVIGTPLKNYYTEESVKLMLEYGGYERALKGQFTAEERTFVTRDGRKVHTLLHSLPEIHSEGNIGTRAMFVDITARKTAETQTKRLEAALAQSQKMEAIGTLAGGIAHDFNNILSAVIGFAEISLTEISKETRMHRNIEQILIAGMRARDLVRQILTFSRQTEHELKPLRLEPLIKEALKLLRSSLPSTIEINQDIETDLDCVMADPIQIHQIVMNLCTNAAQAMEPMGGQLTIHLSKIQLADGDLHLHPVLNAGAYIKFCVEDTGKGISPEIMDKIYHPYFTTKQKGEGTGLGLSVVHGIIQSYGGAISAYSELNKGTTFNVYIPAIKRPELKTTQEHSPLPTGNERILFVDDEPNLVELGQEMLEMLGYRVTACQGSLAALEIFNHAPADVDLVISDVTMPKMTGDRLAIELLKKRPDLPVILCTGFTKNITPEIADEIGIRKIVTKPIVIDHLAHVIRQVLDGIRLQQT